MDEIEAAVWSLAQKHYGSDEHRILVNSVLDNFRRKPGLDSPVLLHASSLARRRRRCCGRYYTAEPGYSASLEDASRFVSLRQGVRVDLLRAIQSRLLQDGFADVAVKEDFLGWELGL